MKGHFLLEQAYRSYLENKPKVRPVIPPYEHVVHDMTYVSASSLGRCPLFQAKKKRGEQETNPKTAAERLSQLHIMEQGTRDAEPFQEALIYYYGQAEFTDGAMVSDGAVAEPLVRSANLGVTGRIDALLRYEGVNYLYEFKRRDAQRGSSQGPQPKYSDALQALAYGLMTGSIPHIVTLNRYYFNTWTMFPDGDGYVLKNEHGESWGNPMNGPHFISEGSIRREVVLHKYYLENEVNTPPIKDFLNDPRGYSWYCYQWADGKKPMVYKDEKKGERTEFIQPRCEHFCHHPLSGNDQIKVRETEYKSCIYEIVRSSK